MGRCREELAQWSLCRNPESEILMPFSSRHRGERAPTPVPTATATSTAPVPRITVTTAPVPTVTVPTAAVPSTATPAPCERWWRESPVLRRWATMLSLPDTPAGL
ncbi:hypothetical protein CB1_000529010 [Camelus ferus]|nr:hypothetical protein CB1_000529010 [Camelus ferus]